MNKKSGTSKAAADKLVKTIRRKTRQTYSSEEKIRIILAGLRGEETISVLCRREGRQARPRQRSTPRCRFIPCSRWKCPC
jgi:transposase